MSQRCHAEVADGVGHLPRVPVPALDQVRHRAHLRERHLVDQARGHERGALHALDLRVESLGDPRRSMRSLPCTVLTVMPVTAGSCSSSGFDGGSRFTNSDSPDNPSSSSVRNASPSSAPSSASRSAIDVDDRARLDERIEAAAHAEVEREVVRRLRQRARAPGRRRHHADAGDQHVDLVRAVRVGVDARVARSASSTCAPAAARPRGRWRRR